MSCTLNSLIMVYTGSTECARAWAWCEPFIDTPFAVTYHEVVLTRVSSRASLSKLGLSGTSFVFLCAMSDHFPKVLVLGHSFVKRLRRGTSCVSLQCVWLSLVANVFLAFPTPISISKRAFATNIFPPWSILIPGLSRGSIGYSRHFLGLAFYPMEFTWTKRAIILCTGAIAVRFCAVCGSGPRSQTNLFAPMSIA